MNKAAVLVGGMLQSELKKALPRADEEKTITPLLTCRQDFSPANKSGPLNELAVEDSRDSPPILKEVDSCAAQLKKKLIKIIVRPVLITYKPKTNR